MPIRPSYDAPAAPDPNCRSCVDFKTWSRQQLQLSKAESDASHVENRQGAVVNEEATSPTHEDCPLDKDALGRSTWGLLHTIGAVYPPTPTDDQKKDVQTFFETLSRIYPCDSCARDFRRDLKENPVEVASQESFSQWLCRFHNRVNRKLGKPTFDCSLVNDRWRDGWKDGSCN